MYERLQKAIDNFDLAEYLEEHFSDIKEAAGGVEYRLNCFSPKGCCGSDTDHKLYVNVDEKRWICFKCGYGTKEQRGTGYLVRFIADVEGIPPALIRHRLSKTVHPTPSEHFEDLLRDLFLKAESPSAKSECEETVIKLPHVFYPLREPVGTLNKHYLDYIKERGLEDTHLGAWDVRFCHKTLTTELKPWTARIIFPIRDLEGRVRSAVGRAFPGKRQRQKWINWPDSDLSHMLWPLGYIGKDDKWYTFSSSLYSERRVVLTEGIFDALAVNFGAMDTHYFTGLCTFGKKISEGQIDLLRNLKVKDVILAWDKDAKKASKRAVETLKEDFSVSVFPYNSPIWNHYDLGDTISLAKGPIPIKDGIVEEELKQAIPVESSLYLSWLMR
jgi:hypothetical protein